jgi:hypothetical protein
MAYMAVTGPTLRTAATPPGAPIAMAVRPQHPEFRVLHSSTFQLNVSTFRGLRASTFRWMGADYVEYWEVSWAKPSQVELRSGPLLWLQ